MIPEHNDTHVTQGGHEADSPIGLMLLLDTLTAVGDQVAKLPAPLRLFAAELEAGLAETLAGASHGL